MNIEEAFDDLSVRFLLATPFSDLKFSERLYFILEESYWFFLDFYQRKNRLPYISFREFCKMLLAHNSLPFIEAEYRAFKIYKRRVPVYGGILLDPEMKHVLLVKGMNNLHYFFPKGKKCKDESGTECCIREVFEEVGISISTKVSRIYLETSRGIFYFVFYVKMDQRFRTLTRYEISSVKWVSIEEIETADIKGPYGVVKSYISKIKEVVENVKENHFRLDINRIMSRVDSRLKTR